MTSLGLVSEALGIGDATKIDKSPKPKAKVLNDPCCDDGEKGFGTVDAAFTSAVINSDVSDRGDI